MAAWVTHPGLNVHQGTHRCCFVARPDRIDISQGRVDLVEEVCYFREVVPVASCDGPSVVDHHEAGSGDLDFITGHGDERRSRGGQAKHLNGYLALVFAQQVVDRQALENIAAWAVDFHRDVFVANAAQSSADALGGDTLARPPIHADRVVHGDGGGVVTGCRLDRWVPALHGLGQ